jgi:hypothetical protein
LRGRDRRSRQRQPAEGDHAAKRRGRSDCAARRRGSSLWYGRSRRRRIRCLGRGNCGLGHGAARKQQYACQAESADPSGSARCGFAHRRLHSVLRFAAPKIRRQTTEAHQHACFASGGYQR